MYASIYVYMYVCVCIYIYMRVYKCIYAYEYLYIYIYMSDYIFYTHIYIYVYIRMYVHMYILKIWGPCLLLVGYPCTDHNIFNENLNFSQRLHELQARQDADNPRRRFLANLCKSQHSAGRFVLIQDPRRSRIWGQTEFKELAELGLSLRSGT